MKRGAAPLLNAHSIIIDVWFYPVFLSEMLFLLGFQRRVNQSIHRLVILLLSLFGYVDVSYPRLAMYMSLNVSPVLSFLG